jgi:hypothetical protein
MSRSAADGWERRFVADARRVEDLSALYRSAGFEVAADPVNPGELPDGCETCLLALATFRTLYTRRPPGAAAHKEAE